MVIPLYVVCNTMDRLMICRCSKTKLNDFQMAEINNDKSKLSAAILIHEIPVATISAHQSTI